MSADLPIRLKEASAIHLRLGGLFILLDDYQPSHPMWEATSKQIVAECQALGALMGGNLQPAGKGVKA